MAGWLRLRSSLVVMGANPMTVATRSFRPIDESAQPSAVQRATCVMRASSASRVHDKNFQRAGFAGLFWQEYLVDPILLAITSLRSLHCNRRNCSRPAMKFSWTLLSRISRIPRLLLPLRLRLCRAVFFAVHSLHLGFFVCFVSFSCSERSLGSARKYHPDHAIRDLQFIEKQKAIKETKEISDSWRTLG